MILTSLNKLKSLKFSGKVAVACDICKKQFTKTKRQLYHNNRELMTEEGFIRKNTCSKECQNSLQLKRDDSHCKKCDKKFSYIHHQHQTYCSKKCANEDRTISEKTKEKIRISLINKNKDKFAEEIKMGIRSKKGIKLFARICKICNNSFFGRRTAFICSKKCGQIASVENGRKGGRISATKILRRSKAEIKLFDLFSKKYQCLHNYTLFNGWDADIIIPSKKLAILWNGAWHYTKIKENHSLAQVQTRDKIKIGEIIKCGYSFIIVKDYKNKMKPEIAYDRIEECISKENYNLTII